MSTRNIILVLTKMLLAVTFMIVVNGSSNAQQKIPLYTWYSPSREDFFTTSDPSWAGRVGDRRSPDYVFVRIEGQVFNPRIPEPDTVPLYSWWNSARGDNFLTSQARWSGRPGESRDGYTMSRIEGYVYRTPVAGTVPLHLFWNRARQDNYATSDALFGTRPTDGYVGPAVLGYVFPPEQPAPHTLADFGYGTLRLNGTPAVGRRPMLVLLVEFSDARFRDGRDREYYNRLIFGPGFPNIADYYSEISSSRFTWQSAGCIGPILAPDIRGTSQDESKYQEGMFDEFDQFGNARREGRKMAGRALEIAATQYGVDFSRYDANRDGTVSTDELGIVMIHAGPGENLSAANRGSDPGRVQPLRSTVGVQAVIAIAGDGASFASIAHEIFHSLGAVWDLYGSGNHSEGLTLMSATIWSGRERRETFHLDPWYKMRLGWVEPRIIPMNNVGNAVEIIATQVAGVDLATRSLRRPILLYDVARGTREYFMVEFRSSSAAGGGYDASINDWRGNRSGIAVWHAKVDDSNNPLSLPGIQITPGVNRSRIDTSPRCDDVAVDADGNGILDRVTPGDDRQLQTVPTGNDRYWDDQSVFMRGAPNGRRGDAALLLERDGDMLVDWLIPPLATAPCTGFRDLSSQALRVRVGYTNIDGTRIWLEWAATGPLIPRIDNLAASGQAGSLISLRGMFGVAQGTKIINLYDDDLGRYSVPVTRWTATEITARVPDGIPPGQYSLIIYTDATRRSQSNWRPFDVR